MSTREDIYKRLDHIKIDLEHGRYTQAKEALEATIGALETIHKIPMPEGVFIMGKRWFQRSYGNTYHSVTIIVDGDILEYIPFEYGYDDQYKQTAHDWFKTNGYDVPEKYYDFISAFDVAFMVRDVDHKRDL